MRLPNTAHTSRPWRIHEITRDFDRLRGCADEPAIVELTAAIALENYRGRFNHAVGLGSQGFCELPANGRPATEAVA
jgi:hypothetical protein